MTNYKEPESKRSKYIYWAVVVIAAAYFIVRTLISLKFHC